MRRINQPDLVALVKADREDEALHRWAQLEDERILVHALLGQVGREGEMPAILE